MKITRRKVQVVGRVAQNFKVKRVVASFEVFISLTHFVFTHDNMTPCRLLCNWTQLFPRDVRIRCNHLLKSMCHLLLYTLKLFLFKKMTLVSLQIYQSNWNVKESEFAWSRRLIFTIRCKWQGTLKDGVSFCKTMQGPYCAPNSNNTSIT